MADKHAVTQNVMATGTAHAVSFLVRPATERTAAPADYGMVAVGSGDPTGAAQYATRMANTPDAGSIRVPLSEGRDLTCLGFHAVAFAAGSFAAATDATLVADLWLEVEHQFKGGADTYEYEYLGRLTLTVQDGGVVAGSLMAPAAAGLCSIADPATADVARDPGIRISGGGAEARSWAKFDHEGATAVMIAFADASVANLFAGVVCKQV